MSNHHYLVDFMLSTVKFSANSIEIFFHIFPRKQELTYDISCKLSPICMKYHILFSGKNKKNVTNLSSAELTQRVVKVKHHHMTQDCKNMVAITYISLHWKEERHLCTLNIFSGFVLILFISESYPTLGLTQQAFLNNIFTCFVTVPENFSSENIKICCLGTLCLHHNGL